MPTTLWVPPGTRYLLVSDIPWLLAAAEYPDTPDREVATVEQDGIEIPLTHSPIYDVVILRAMARGTWERTLREDIAAGRFVAYDPQGILRLRPSEVVYDAATVLLPDLAHWLEARSRGTIFCRIGPPPNDSGQSIAPKQTARATQTKQINKQARLNALKDFIEEMESRADKARLALQRPPMHEAGSPRCVCAPVPAIQGRELAHTGRRFTPLWRHLPPRHETEG